MKVYQIIRANGEWLYVQPGIGSLYWFKDQGSGTEFSFDIATVWRHTLGADSHSIVSQDRKDFRR